MEIYSQIICPNSGSCCQIQINQNLLCPVKCVSQIVSWGHSATTSALEMQFKYFS